MVSCACDRYTIVSTMNMKACSGITRMWKQAQTTPSTSWPMAPPMPASEVMAKLPPSTASSRKIISPA